MLAPATRGGDNGDQRRTSGFIPNVHHLDVMRGILEGILATGDVSGAAGPGRTTLAVTVDDCLFDELADFGTDLEDLEPDDAA